MDQTGHSQTTIGIENQWVQPGIRDPRINDIDSFQARNRFKKKAAIEYQQVFTLH
jgi:hypothetical protein